MYLDKYDNHEFSRYLNRHLSGIIKLSEKIKKLSLFFELSEAFSNYACRLYIDVDFIDDNLLDEQEIRLANRFFYNYLVVKNLVLDECVIEVAELETEPLFNYVSEFLQHKKYQKDKKF
jgi:hypothetical protein